MPLPWLIGAAVVAAAAAVVKAVSDDDSPSSSNSGDAERRRQEREAQLQRERDGLAAQVVSLKKDRLEEARALLALSAETLEQLPRKTVGLNTSNFESALMAKLPASSAYAQSLSAILDLTDYGEKTSPKRSEANFWSICRYWKVCMAPSPSAAKGSLTSSRSARSAVAWTVCRT